MHPKRWIPWVVSVSVILLVLLGVAAVVFRMAFLSSQEAGLHADSFERRYAEHPFLTSSHIFPGLLFMLIGPLQFAPRVRSRIGLHRWLGRLYIAGSPIVAISAVLLGFRLAVGGVSETVATTVFALFFLFSIGKALTYVLQGQTAAHREWMIRAFAIGLAVSTVRLIVAIFFALVPITHQSPQDFFGLAFWIAFTLHSLLAEAWIRYTRPAAAANVDRPGVVQDSGSAKSQDTNT